MHKLRVSRCRAVKDGIVKLPMGYLRIVMRLAIAAALLGTLRES